MCLSVHACVCLYVYINTGESGNDTDEDFNIEDLVNLKGEQWCPSCVRCHYNVFPVLMDNFVEALDKIPLDGLGQTSKDGRYTSNSMYRRVGNIGSGKLGQTHK